MHTGTGFGASTGTGTVRTRGIITDPTALAHTLAPNAALDAHTHRHGRPDKRASDPL